MTTGVAAGPTPPDLAAPGEAEMAGAAVERALEAVAVPPRLPSAPRPGAHRRPSSFGLRPSAPRARGGAHRRRAAPGDAANSPRPDEASAASGPSAQSQQPEQAELKTKAARGGAWLAISALLTKGSQIGLLLVLAVLLDPRDLGLLAIGTLVFNVVMVMQDLGITDVITRSWDRGVAASEAVARTALTVTTAGASALVAVIWVAAPVLADAIGTPRATWVVRWMVLPVPLVAVSWVQMARMQRDMDFRRRVVPDAIPALVGVATTITLLVVHRSVGIWAMVIGNAVTCVLSPVCAALVGYSLRPGWDRGYAKEILAWGRHAAPASVLLLITLNVDYILVARWLGDQQLGYYSLAFRISYVPFVLFVTVLNAAAFPYYVRMRGSVELRRAIERVNGVLATLVFALCGSLFLFAPAITLLGEQWAPAEGALRGLAVYGALNAIAYTLQAPLRVAGRIRLYFASQALHLVLLTIFLVVLVPHGVTAVGVAQALAAGLLLLGSQLMLTRTVGWTLADLGRSLYAPVIATGAMAVVVWLLGRTGLRADTWIGIVVLAAAGLGTYVVALLVSGRGRTIESLRVLRGKA